MIINRFKDWLRQSWCGFEGGHSYTAIHTGAGWALKCVACGHISDRWGQK